MNEQNNTSLTQKYLSIGKLEGYSYLILLCIAMPLKYVYGYPIAVKIAGSLHGILFIAFVYYIFKMYQDKQLDIKSAAIALLLSIIPFGTFFLRKTLK
ncbi:MAG: DUF3817 domain-containing protein [Chitinophagales bacterium]|nr:DUF3817 domain-containing protein [Bacteroidota bacterium]